MGPHSKTQTRASPRRFAENIFPQGMRLSRVLPSNRRRPGVTGPPGTNTSRGAARRILRPGRMIWLATILLAAAACSQAVTGPAPDSLATTSELSPTAVADAASDLAPRSPTAPLRVLTPPSPAYRWKTLSSTLSTGDFCASRRPATVPSNGCAIESHRYMSRVTTPWTEATGSKTATWSSATPRKPMPSPTPSRS